MSEYIERGALKAHYSWLPKDATLTPKDFDDIIDVQPAADVEPVVRCKECVNSRELYGDGLESVYNEMWCEDSGRIVIENGFCECGERRGGI